MKPSESIFQPLILPMEGLGLERKHSILDNQQILKKEISERVYEDIIFVYEYLLSFQYFRKIKNNHGQECLFRLAQYSQLISHGDSTAILKKNEEPNAIHFIIEGQVMQITGKQCQVHNVADVIFEDNILNCVLNKSDFIASKNSVFIIINGFIFRATLHKYQPYKHNISIRHQLLSILGKYDYQDLVNSMKIETINKHQTVYSIYEEAKYIYFIISGTLSIGQKIGTTKTRDFSNVSKELLSSAVREKDQFNFVAFITQNDVFGFEEFLEKKKYREYKVIGQSPISEIAKFPVELFFTKFNQVFNQKEYMQFVKMSRDRNRNRNKIHSLQLDLHVQQSRSESKNTQLMTYETLEPIPFENQIRSKPRSFLLKNTVLLPDDTLHRSIDLKNKETIDFNLHTVQEGQEISKGNRLRINYQIDKLLHINKSFDKTKLLSQRQQLSSSRKCSDYINRFYKHEAQKQYDHISLRQDKSVELDSLQSYLREKQNKRYSPLPQISPLYSRLGTYKQRIKSQKQPKQPLIILNNQI